MDIYSNKSFVKHNFLDPIEGSYRIADLLTTGNFVTVNLDKKGDTKLIHSVHTREHIAYVRKCADNREELAQIRLTPESYSLALLAAKTTYIASLNNGFAVVRPPGHHAQRNKAAGFCFFNNIAVATTKLLQKGLRVAIMDIDGHHGDGTESIFAHVPNVIYCSIHQKVDFMKTGHTSFANCYNFLHEAPIYPVEYHESFDKCVNIIRSFHPDVIGVSAGFDTYKDDPLLDFKLDIADYSLMAKKLTSITGNVFATLEGGYHTKVQECLESFISGISSNK